MAKDSDSLEFSEAAKTALEQTHQVMDTYFDFLKNPSRHFLPGGTEIGWASRLSVAKSTVPFQTEAAALPTAELIVCFSRSDRYLNCDDEVGARFQSPRGSSAS